MLRTVCLRSVCADYWIRRLDVSRARVACVVAVLAPGTRPVGRKGEGRHDSEDETFGHKKIVKWKNGR